MHSNIRSTQRNLNRSSVLWNTSFSSQILHPFQNMNFYIYFLRTYYVFLANFMGFLCFMFFVYFCFCFSMNLLLERLLFLFQFKSEQRLVLGINIINSFLWTAWSLRQWTAWGDGIGLTYIAEADKGSTAAELHGLQGHPYMNFLLYLNANSFNTHVNNIKHVEGIKS